MVSGLVSSSTGSVVSLDGEQMLKQRKDTEHWVTLGAHEAHDVVDLSQMPPAVFEIKPILVRDALGRVRASAAVRLRARANVQASLSASAWKRSSPRQVPPGPGIQGYRMPDWRG